MMTWFGCWRFANFWCGRSRLLALATVYLLTACSTIVTRIHSRDVLVRAPLNPNERHSTWIEEHAGIAPPKSRSAEATARSLAHWAGQDPYRLTLAAQDVLELRVSGSERNSGFSLVALELAWRSLQASGVPASQWLETTTTKRTIAIALDRFVWLNAKELARGISSREFWTPLGPIEVSTTFLAHAPYRAGYFDTFIPANHVSVKGMGKRVSKEGLGVALVGVRKRAFERGLEMFYQRAGKGVLAPFAAVAEFDSTPVPRARIELIDLNRHSEIAATGGGIALTGDFTAPFALSFRGINEYLLGFSAMINIEKRKKDAGLYLVEPFDPDRIPVVFIHGLTSTPLVWRRVAPILMADPVVRRNYQFWYVFYPSGMPIPESSASIRDDIATIRKTYDPRGTSVASRHMVIVGYSMGGVIAHVLSTSVGSRYWEAIARVPFDRARLDSEDRAKLNRVLFWSAVPGLDRTIFIGTPHRGTRLADSRRAGFGHRLVNLPTDFIQFQIRMFRALGDILQGDFLAIGLTTGINSLSPSSPLYKALASAPFAPGLKFHSIIADRGKGDGVYSTDGIVGYWSSHLPGAQSELIVPTDHHAHLHPATLTHIRHILRLNLRKR
jgi:hypothetical protein